MRPPAWWRRRRATIEGWFWLPCPICGEMFAGYEKGCGSLYIGDGLGEITCPECPGNHGYPDA